jgi:UDP-2,4-diacetamido-2,4,6-trideoxy-beta-L-altropyranose hydrolase
VNWEIDARQVLAELMKTSVPIKWLIVDHYALNNRWEKTIRQMVQKIIVIDDLADRPHDCDLLLDQNFFAAPEPRYEALVPEHCTRLFGPEFALLRPEFRRAREFSRIRGNGLARILVYFGGNDPGNITGMALEALCSPKLKHMYVDIVVGPLSPYLEDLKEKVKNRPGTRIHIQPREFVELLLRADLCIGAGGTTTWERLCLNVPSVVITVADNQIPSTSELDQAGYVRWLGRAETITSEDIATALSEMLQGLKRSTGQQGPGLVDGWGAVRTAEALIPSSRETLRLRPAKPEDADRYFLWANDKGVRLLSFNQTPIVWKDHQIWFADKLSSEESFLWVLQTAQGLPVGQIRFDVSRGQAHIGYSLDPLVRGRGWSRILVESGLKAFWEYRPKMMVKANVKQENLSSRRVFEGLGFCPSSEEGIMSFSRLPDGEQYRRSLHS